MRYMVNHFYEINFDHLCASVGAIFLIETLHQVHWDEVTKNLSQVAVAFCGIAVMVLNYIKDNKKNNHNNNF